MKACAIGSNISASTRSVPGAVLQLARHQHGVVLALGAGAQGQHGLDEGLRHAAQRGRLGAVHHRAQQRQALVDGGLPVREDGVEQLVLGAVVITHQGQRHAGLGGDLADRDRVVAVLGKQPFGGQQDGRLAVGARRDGGAFAPPAGRATG
jgi:hypothetical protein